MKTGPHFPRKRHDVIVHQKSRSLARHLPSGCGFQTSAPPHPFIHAVFRPDNSADPRKQKSLSTLNRRRSRRGTTSRGYGSVHQATRDAWRLVVAGGSCRCAGCGSRSRLPEAWDLDHRDDRRGYFGPSHRGCNRCDLEVSAAVAGVVIASLRLDNPQGARQRASRRRSRWESRMRQRDGLERQKSRCAR